MQENPLNILSFIGNDRINNMPESQREELITSQLPHVEVASLVERMRAKQPDKYGNALLGINFNLTEEEIAQIRQISGEANNRFGLLTENDPEWAQFLEVVKELEGIGTIFVERVIDDSDNVNTPRIIRRSVTKGDGELTSEVRGIPTSKRMKALFILQNQLSDLTDFVRNPGSEIYHGQSAKNYAQKLELANAFVQQTTSQTIW